VAVLEEKEVLSRVLVMPPPPPVTILLPNEKEKRGILTYILERSSRQGVDVEIVFKDCKWRRMT